MYKSLLQVAMVASVALISDSVVDAAEAKTSAEMTPDELHQAANNSCKDQFNIAIGDLVPGDDPEKALRELTLDLCYNQTDFM
jgi:hypothetical protein